MITLGEIWTAVRTTLNVVSQLLGIASIIQGQTAKAAQENVPFSIDTNASVTVAAVTDSTIGLAAIRTAIDTLTSNQATEFADIMAAIAGIPVTGAPVTLPSVFPSGWVSQMGDSVWGWLVPTRNLPAYFHLTNAGDAAEQRGFPQVKEETPFADALYVVIGDWGQEGVDDPSPNSTWTLDVTTILPTDATSADWLNRVYPSVPWLSPFQNGCLGVNDLGSDNWTWVVDLPIERWLALKQNLGLATTAVSAPLWPGLANVTLGTPVAISAGFTVTGPMDGVIVAISGIAGSKPFFDFDGSLSYRNIGAIAFQDDNGDEELPQTLGFTSAVYCPKNMVSADACLVRADSAVSGTVTPWVRT